MASASVPPPPPSPAIAISPSPITDVSPSPSNTSSAPSQPQTTSQASSSEPIREDMVQNALAFLKHPSVTGTPLPRRVAFMKRKGMNNAEIQEALSRAGVQNAQNTVTSTPAPNVAQPQQYYQQPLQYQPQIPPPAPGPSWTGLALTAVVAAGVGVAATYVAKNYIIPWWKGVPQVPELPEDAAAEVEKKTEDDKVIQLTESVTKQQESCRQMLTEVQAMVQTQSANASLLSEVGTLRSEIQNLKSLLQKKD